MTLENTLEIFYSNKQIPLDWSTSIKTGTLCLKQNQASHCSQELPTADHPNLSPN